MIVCVSGAARYTVGVIGSEFDISNKRTMKQLIYAEIMPL